MVKSFFFGFLVIFVFFVTVQILVRKITHPASLAERREDPFPRRAGLLTYDLTPRTTLLYHRTYQRRVNIEGIYFDRNLIRYPRYVLDFVLCLN